MVVSDMTEAVVTASNIVTLVSEKLSEGGQLGYNADPDWYNRQIAELVRLDRNSEPARLIGRILDAHARKTVAPTGIDQELGGWYLTVPAGYGLLGLVRHAGYFGTMFQDLWFYTYYGKWPEMAIESIATQSIEVIVPETSDWLLQGSRGKSRSEVLRMGAEYSKTLPEGWFWEEPSAETLTYLAFKFHQVTGSYPLGGNDWAWCSNRIKAKSGGERLFCGAHLNDWCVQNKTTDYAGLGGLRWAVRRGQV